MAPSWLCLGSEAGYNELLCWPCLNYGWPEHVRTQKPTQNEADFGTKWLQIRLQETLHSALMLAPAELLLHYEYDAMFIVQQARHRAMMLCLWWLLSYAACMLNFVSCSPRRNEQSRSGASTMRRGSLRSRRLHHAGVLATLAPTGADQPKAWPTLSKTDSSKL